jgi:hypothetical protein
VTALQAVAIHLPPRSVPIEEVGERLGLTARQTLLFRRFHGLDRIRLDPGGTVENLLHGAVSALTQLRETAHRIRYVVYATSLPVQVPYPGNPLRAVCREFGLEHALSFKVSHHACASGLLAIDVAGRLLDADAALVDATDATAAVAARRRTASWRSCSPGRRPSPGTPSWRRRSRSSARAPRPAWCSAGGGTGQRAVLPDRAARRVRRQARRGSGELLTAYNRAYPELLEGAIRERPRRRRHPRSRTSS